MRRRVEREGGRERLVKWWRCMTCSTKARDASMMRECHVRVDAAVEGEYRS